MQMIVEREYVFQMNNKIIKSFKLPRGAYIRTVFRILPPELTLTIIFIIFALFAVNGSRRVMIWASRTEVMCQHMKQVDET